MRSKYQAKDKEVLKNTSRGLHKDNLHTGEEKRISKKELEDTFDVKDTDNIPLGRMPQKDTAKSKRKNRRQAAVRAAMAVHHASGIRNEDAGQDQETESVIEAGAALGIEAARYSEQTISQSVTEIFEAEDTLADGYEEKEHSARYDITGDDHYRQHSLREDDFREDRISNASAASEALQTEGDTTDGGVWHQGSSDTGQKQSRLQFRNDNTSSYVRKVFREADTGKGTFSISSPTPDNRKTRNDHERNRRFWQDNKVGNEPQQDGQLNQGKKQDHSPRDTAFRKETQRKTAFRSERNRETPQVSDAKKAGRGKLQPLQSFQRADQSTSESDGAAFSEDVRYSEAPDASGHISEKLPEEKEPARYFDVIRQWRTDTVQHDSILHNPEYQTAPEKGKSQSHLKFKEDTGSSYVREVFWDTDRDVSPTESRDSINRTCKSAYDDNCRVPRLVFSDSPPSDRSYGRMQDSVSVQVNELSVRHFSEKLHDSCSVRSAPEQKPPKNINKEIQKRRYKRTLLTRFAPRSIQPSLIQNTPVGQQSVKQISETAIKPTAIKTIPGFKSIAGAIAVIVLMLSLVLSAMTGCTAILGGGAVIMASTFPSADEDIVSVDGEYSRLERELDAQINRMEQTHPGMDEMYCPLPVVGGQSSGSLEDHASHDDPSYVYQVDEITHNPFQLAAILSAKFGNYRPMDVIGELPYILELQYTLTVKEKTQVRQKEITDPVTGETKTKDYEAEVLYVTLTNHGLDYAAGQYLTPEQFALYESYVATKGNKRDLFDENSITVSPAGGATGGSSYTVPPEALSDSRFRNMINEAEKYLGMPYVWGGSTPATSFDCSGFVSWVVNHCGNGWNVGRQTAEGLRSQCAYVSPEEARPGDLIFFQGTYNTTGASHIGIYVGDGMMIHAGKPIQYANVNTPYFKAHFYQYGRLP